MQWGPRRSWPRLAPFIPSLALALLWSAILTAQLLGIYFTFARGPWVGITIALAGFLGLVAIFAGWRALGRAAAIIAFTVALLHGLDIIPLLGFGIWLSPIIGLGRGPHFGPCLHGPARFRPGDTGRRVRGYIGPGHHTG